MAPTSEQRAQIIGLLKEGLDSNQIAKRVGVSVGTVRSIRANMTMGRYAERPAEEEEIAEAFDATFGLEQDLQTALRKDIGQLESGLKITDGGKEQNVESGRIDITAQDSAGAAVVIELKKGAADRETVGQILGYMGDMMASKKAVRGILVAGDFPARTIAAARAVPNLKLKKYSFRFSFESVGDT